MEVFHTSFFGNQAKIHESFEPLIGLLAFLVQKLWPKKHKMII